MILQSISFFSDITISPISNLLEDEKEVAIKDSETILNLFEAVVGIRVVGYMNILVENNIGAFALNRTWDFHKKYI